MSNITKHFTPLATELNSGSNHFIGLLRGPSMSSLDLILMRLHCPHEESGSPHLPIQCVGTALISVDGWMYRPI